MMISKLRSAATVALCLLIVTASSLAAIGQDKADGPQEKTVQTQDGWTIHFSYWESTMGQDAPVVILLHGDKTTRVQWKASGLPDLLAKEQYAVIAVDLRKHGDSQPPEDAPPKLKSDKLTKFDYEAMVAGDLEAVKKFIYEEHQAKRLNMRKIGIVATEFSTPIAVAWAAMDWAKKPYDDAPTLDAKTPRGQDVQALALISPQDSVTGISTIQPLRLLRATSISALMLTGDMNVRDARTVQKMYQGFGGDQQDKENPRFYMTTLEKIKLSGLDLLTKYRDPQGRPTAMIAMLSFLHKHVFEHKADWKDRESRLN